VRSGLEPTLAAGQIRCAARGAPAMK